MDWLSKSTTLSRVGTFLFGFFFQTTPSGAPRKDPVVLSTRLFPISLVDWLTDLFGADLFL